ncbi:unnamed protein product [Hymenolepis diminuta]|uniref:Cytochrome c oxidase assembly factor 6 homolog n=1 Tax=Hymenolepis diminuta TaxID=6216 RepID=A0A564XXI7_HYMDI|nr:unnamed protein product [Hymenolepis diminuta]
MSGEEAEIRFNFAKNVPSKEEREKCWAARDEFWKCMKSIYEHGPLVPGAPRPKVNYDKCRDLRRAYKSVCPRTWINVFDKQHGGFNEEDFEEQSEK